MTRHATATLHPAPAPERRFIGKRSYLVIPDYQVALSFGGPWHRRGSIDDEAACGVRIAGMTTVLRGYSLDDKLCIECHTPHELKLGAAAVLAGGPRSFFDTEKIT